MHPTPIYTYGVVSKISYSLCCEYQLGSYAIMVLCKEWFLEVIVRNLQGILQHGPISKTPDDIGIVKRSKDAENDLDINRCLSECYGKLAIAYEKETISTPNVIPILDDEDDFVIDSDTIIGQS